ncbi:MAG: relaxase/mobilization nuclease domain-containing protein [Parvularcula sp.]|jgi:hypothetical protein|nr:relaxase/mobilization nuclease domain-containing protein [Parvularcula sp.]
MILVGNQRGGASDLAQHLLKDENDHVTVHEVRGFACDDLGGALHEAYAMSRATKCRQFLFSLSLNPPPIERVGTDVFERAIDDAEERLGLTGQPRVIVFHEKEGRRHAHAVWSRIDAETMTAKPLPFTKRTLQGLARDLYLEHGWRMPEGFTDPSKKDPRNYSLAEWQQAKRAGKDPKAIKSAFQDAWKRSDDRRSFQNAIEERGLRLAKGDRRGFVAVDTDGEVYPIARWAGVKTKAVRDRLGDENDLPSLDEVRKQIAADMLGTTERLKREHHAQADAAAKEFKVRRSALVEGQRQERTAFETAIAERSVAEANERQARLRSGLRGLWDRMTGKRAETISENEQAAELSRVRDRNERDQLVFTHLAQRRLLVAERHGERRSDRLTLTDLHQDAARYDRLGRSSEHTPPEAKRHRPRGLEPER